MAFDRTIIKKTIDFLKKFVEPFWIQKPSVHVPAATAIMSETTYFPTISQQGFTTSGIKIENVMRHLGEVGKEEYLDVIDFQI